MNETEPKYFTEFRLNLDKKLDERFDSQEEQIAKVSEDLTMLTKKVEKMEIDINTIKGDIVIMKVDIAENKAELVEVKDILRGKADKTDLVGFNRRLLVLERKSV